MNNDIRSLLMSLDANSHNACIVCGSTKAFVHVEGIGWTIDPYTVPYGKMTFTIPTNHPVGSGKVSYSSCYGQNRDKVDKSRPGWSIKEVIFNDPATIVFWQDGSKTVVKSHNEPFDPEKGLAMAICKKVFGNEGNYFNVFRKWLPEDCKTSIPKKPSKPWQIWYREFRGGAMVGSGVHHKAYRRKNDATRVARKLYGDTDKYEFIVSMANPWKEV